MDRSQSTVVVHRLLPIVLVVVACGASAAEQPPRADLIIHNEAAINETMREQQNQNHERIRQLRKDLRREVDRNNDQRAEAEPRGGQERQTWREPPPGNGAGNPPAKTNEQVRWSDPQPPRLQRLSPEERSRLREDVRGFWNERGAHAQPAPRR